MKKILLTLAVLLAMGGTVTTSAQRHRHTPRTEAVAAPADQGIEAYSDTSSVAVDSADVADDSADDDADFGNATNFNNPFSWLAFMNQSNFMGSVATIFIIVLVMLFLLMPFIIILMVLRYLVKRHNDRVRLAEKAMENGVPLSEEQLSLGKKSPEYLWRRGVRNVSIGVGLAFFLYFLGCESLTGIGVLIACLGAGQMFMVKYNYDSKIWHRRKDSDRFDDRDSGTRFDDNDLR